jgi:hypothetical protein
MRVKAIRPFLPLLCMLFPWAIPAQTPAKDVVQVQFTATSESVSGAGEAVKINVSSWSTDADRDQLAAAWMMTAASAAPAAGARGGRGGGAAGGRGGGRGGRGARGAATPAAADDPALPVDPDAVDPDSPAFRFGRGGARGARGDASNAPQTPESSLAAQLKKNPTVGILWTSETVGYSIKYAYRLRQADGSERMILATDRRLGVWNNRWKPVGSATAPDYPFSVLELRLNSKGEGEAKGSVTGKIAVDAEAKTIALDGYAAAPVVLKGVKRH